MSRKNWLAPKITAGSRNFFGMTLWWLSARHDGRDSKCRVRARKPLPDQCGRFLSFLSRTMSRTQHEEVIDSPLRVLKTLCNASPPGLHFVHFHPETGQLSGVLPADRASVYLELRASAALSSFGGGLFECAPDGV